MNTVHNQITYEQANSFFLLDCETGKLFWKERPKKDGGVKIGDEAGYLNPSGYIKISVFGRLYRAHRIVWLLHTGAWPKEQIDHINGIRSDNRPENLRDVSRSLNMQNRRGPQANNKSASTVPGVCWMPSVNSWRAQCKINGVNVLRKNFRSQAEAEACVLEFRSANFKANTMAKTLSEHYAK